MIEFFDRLVGPIDTDGVRIYRQRTSITQLVVMMVLAVICYQFTAIGDSVYAEAMKHFIMNPTTFMKIEQLPMVNIIEINGLLQKLSTTTPLWDVSRWLLLYDDYFNRCIPLYCLCTSGNRYLHVEHWCTLCFR